eukprot:TRINITY_DN1224_c0_g1_i2.p1 TRINITY_DN1224_c0_g1~~TRINITY_DN1224_c0_g1_i2.p1  ORF type:complete len:285 (-),score=54.11 TRINITY_DN1224_c0_g1_i2:357-1211(-)
MLTLNVVPGKSIGFFVLGMSMAEAIADIQHRNKIISHVEIKYNQIEPLANDIVLDLIQDGILLRFDSLTQRLRVVEIYNVSQVCLMYSSSIFSSAESSPTLVTISERFGPTHPGEFDSSTGLYFLNYPGLAFAFPIPRKYESLYANGEIPPTEFPDRQTPIACRIYLYIGNDFKADPVLPPLPPNTNYFEEIIVKVSQYIEFTKRQARIDFQSSPQDVLTLLGHPSRVFYKEEDKMKIHTQSYSGLGCEDYFYNYFNLGIDFLFDSQSHLVKKNYFAHKLSVSL